MLQKPKSFFHGHVLTTLKMLLCRLNECSWRHIAIQILYVRASVRPSVHPSVKVSVNLFQIAPVRTGSLQL